MNGVKANRYDLTLRVSERNVSPECFNHLFHRFIISQ